MALLTDMGQPLGSAAGNWIELVEAVELLRGKRPAESEDLRELSLILAGWMIHLGGQAETPEDGYARAEAALEDGSALKTFLAMVEAQGGDVAVFDDPMDFTSRARRRWWRRGRRGFVAEMDTTALGWAVQRTGAGREKAGRASRSARGHRVPRAARGICGGGQPMATVYATDAGMLREPVEILKQAMRFAKTPPEPVELVSRIFTRESAEKYLRNAVR